MQKVSLEYIYLLWKPELVKLCVITPLTCALFIKRGRRGRDVVKEAVGEEADA